jgi:hypothetical protein
MFDYKALDFMFRFIRFRDYIHDKIFTEMDKEIYMQMNHNMIKFFYKNFKFKKRNV